MFSPTSRRRFLRDLGLSAAALPFAMNLPSLAWANSTQKKQRLVVVFSPNGVVPKTFWPEQTGTEFTLPESISPLAAFKDKLLFLRGVSDRIGGDGDNHMRGIGCLLTGIELFPGNIQGGSHTPAGWASGISVDQEIKTFLQSRPETRTRFGSLEFGVMVPERADTWTRMVYAAGNKPIAPIDDPYQMFHKLYGRMKDQANLGSILDDVLEDLKRLEANVSPHDRQLLEEHAGFVRAMEQEIAASKNMEMGHAIPVLEPGLRHENDQMPQLTKLQTDLLVHSFAADFNRIATFQFTNSVGGAKLRWAGVEEGHHELSHEPDSNESAQEKLTKINKWYCEQIAYLCQQLANTPEADGSGSLLDNTLVVWTNELGQGNSHTLDNIPFLMVGGAPGFKMGQSLKFDRVPHNRLLLSIAHAFGHHLDRFGNPDYCKDGPLTGIA